MADYSECCLLGISEDKARGNAVQREACKRIRRKANQEVKPDSAGGLNPLADSGGFSLFRLFTKLLFHV